MSNTEFEVMFDILTDSSDPTGPTIGNLYINTVKR
jgi:hypothetical protein